MYIITLITIFIFPLTLSAATVSGEISPIKKPNVTQKPSAPKITYFTGPKGTCYTIVKNMKTKKDTKKYVDKKNCKQR